MKLEPGEVSAIGIYQTLAGTSDEKWGKGGAIRSDDSFEALEAELKALTEERLAKLVENGVIRLYAKRNGEQETVAEFAKEIEFFTRYVLHEEAKEEEVESNDATGTKVRRDEGHSGKTLKDFADLQPAKDARLTELEVAALRLYTSSLFRVINGALREKNRLEGAPHPLKETTMHLDKALKKLRAVHFCSASNKRFMTRYLWRGMKDMVAPENLATVGGCDLACMSASPNLAVVAKYAQSERPLILRFKVDSPMDLGADIKWVSMFPREEEFVYPPLTYIKQLFVQDIKHLAGHVITVVPSFSS